MHAKDNDWTGFEWVDLADYAASVITFLRKSSDGAPVLWAFNFTPVVRENYAVGCRIPGFWREIVNTDSTLFGGANAGNDGGVMAQAAAYGNWPHYLSLTLPPLAAVAFTPE